jgi:hypothetical protein
MTENHGVPTTAELVDAVREFLQRDVIPAADARVGYLARVAVNVLTQCERELTLGPAQDRDADAALVRAIREGTYDDRVDELVAALRASTIQRLRISNPRYLRPEDQP